jgi:hypothetical protein
MLFFFYLTKFCYVISNDIFSFSIFLYFKNQEKSILAFVGCRINYIIYLESEILIALGIENVIQQIRAKSMTKNNSTNLSLWRTFVKRLKKILKEIQKPLRQFSTKYPDISQIIQLSFIYFFAVVDLLYSILNNVFALGSIPEFVRPFYPFIVSILQSPFFQIWASPEKVFFMSYVVIELMIVRSTFNFSKLVKYNVLLIFSMLMIQGLSISYWDLLFHRQIATPVANWAWDQGAFIFLDKPLALAFFYGTFLIFIAAYFYLYITAVRGKFAKFPGMEWLTDSVAFWLRIKTPTMRFGKRKKRGKGEKKEKE